MHVCARARVCVYVNSTSFSFARTKEDLLSLRAIMVQLKEPPIQASNKSTFTNVARTALQFLGNVCVMNQGRQALVWDLYFSEVFL